MTRMFPIFLALPLALLFFISTETNAVTITVTTADDVLATDGLCSLREAVIRANTDPVGLIVLGECDLGSGDDEIVFDPSLNGIPIELSIAGSGEDDSQTGDLDILTNITITGNGSENTIIDGGGIDRVIDIISGHLIFTGATIQKGASSETGGGIRNQDTLTLDFSVVKDNEANAGGGIRNSGTMLSSHLTVTNNMTIDSGSTNPQGAGINNSGMAVIMESSITNNKTAPTGFREGGGIRNVGGTLSVFNSTVSGNSASVGGGIRNQNGNIVLGNVTITDNTGGGLSHFSFSGLDQVVLENTIVAENNPVADNDCLGDPVTSNGNNLDSDNSCNLIDPSDIPNTDPMLGPLADNGGDTQTHLLLAGSPAIDMGGTCLVTDQRGVIRPQDGDDDGTATCDIGALEMLLSELIPQVNQGSGGGCSLAPENASSTAFPLYLLIPALILFRRLRRKQK